MKKFNLKKYVNKTINHSKRLSLRVFKKIGLYLKTNLLVEIFLIVNLINGVMLRNFTVKNIFDIKPLLGDLTILITVGAFSHLFKPKNQIKYLFSWSIVFSLVCFINCVYYSNYISFASFSMLTTATELTGYTDAVIQNILELKDFIFFIVPFVLLFFHFQLKKKDYYVKVSRIEKKKKRLFSELGVALITLGMFVTHLTSTDLSRLNKQWNRQSIVMEFGIYIYQANDAVSLIKTKVNIDNHESTLAIVGPKRMEYDKVVSLLDYIKSNLKGNK